MLRASKISSAALLLVLALPQLAGVACARDHHWFSRGHHHEETSEEEQAKRHEAADAVEHPRDRIQVRFVMSRSDVRDNEERLSSSPHALQRPKLCFRVKGTKTLVEKHDVGSL